MADTDNDGIDDLDEPLTASDHLSMIRQELGQPVAGDALLVDAFERLDSQMPLYWRKHVAKQVHGHEYRGAFVKRDAIDFLLGAVWQDVTFNDGDVSEQVDQLHQHLLALREKVEALIAEVDASNMDIVVGPMSKTAPIVPEENQPDPNGRRLRGDAIERRWWGVYRR